MSTTITPDTPATSQKTERYLKSQQARVRRGRIVAIAALVWAVATAIKAVLIITNTEMFQITNSRIGSLTHPDTLSHDINMGWAQLTIAVVGIVGALLLLRSPYRHGLGWGVLMVWAIAMTPVLSANLNNIACNDQILNWHMVHTQVEPLGQRLLVYTRTGVNLVGVIWITILNTVLVPPPLTRQALATDVVLPGPSRKPADDEPEVPNLEGEATQGHGV